MTLSVLAALCDSRQFAGEGNPAATLPAGERALHDALPRTATRKRFLASRWLLRQYLAHLLDQPAASLVVEYPSGEAPRLRGSNLRLSLSHSGHLVFCTAAPVAVGCDIENCRPRPALMALAQRHFHSEETRQLMALAPAERVDAFYCLWTLKEAAKKAVGQGVWSGLQTPAFNLNSRLRRLDGNSGSHWQFAAARLGQEDDHYRAAIALSASGLTVELLYFQPNPAGGVLLSARMPGIFEQCG